MLWGRLGWETAGAACDGGCSLSFNFGRRRKQCKQRLQGQLGAAWVSCCGSSVRRRPQEQLEMEAAEAASARVGGCRSSLRAAGAAGAAQDGVCGCCVRKRLQEQLHPDAVGSAWLGDCWSSLRR